MEAEKLIEKLSQEQNESSKVVRIALAYAEFASLVKRMRKAQDAFNISVSADNIEDIDFWHIRMLELEREVDEHLKKMEI